MPQAFARLAVVSKTQRSTGALDVVPSVYCRGINQQERQFSSSFTMAPKKRKWFLPSSTIAEQFPSATSQESGPLRACSRVQTQRREAYRGWQELEFANALFLLHQERQGFAIRCATHASLSRKKKHAAAGEQRPINPNRYKNMTQSNGLAMTR